MRNASSVRSDHGHPDAVAIEDVLDRLFFALERSEVNQRASLVHTEVSPATSAKQLDRIHALGRTHVLESGVGTLEHTLFRKHFRRVLRIHVCILLQLMNQM